MEKLSVAIITFNEEKNIGRCIDSVREIADEIVIVDGFSTDRTKEICLEKGAIYYQQEWLGYVDTKNIASTKCHHDLVLSLDADEALSEELKAQILEVKMNRTADGYTFNRLTNYCGRWMKYGGWYPDKKLRLFHRNKGRWSGQDIHEFVKLDAHTREKHLTGDLLHYSFYHIEDHVKQASKFALIAADSLFRRGKTTMKIQVIFAGPLRFFRDYFIKTGFLDGYLGLVRCLITAHATFLKYAYLYEANTKRKKQVGILGANSLKEG